MGNALVVQKKLDEGIAAYRQAIQLNPQNAGLYAVLGFALLGQNKLDEALVAFQQARQIEPKSVDPSVTDPQNWNLHVLLAVALLNQNRLDEAIVAFRHAIQLNPKNSDLYDFLGVLLFSQNKLDEAIATFRQAIQLNPKDAKSYTFLGSLLLLNQSKPSDKELAALHQAIPFDPRLDVLFSRHNSDEAIAAFRQAIQLDPKLPEAYTGLGGALIFKNEFDEAVVVLRQVLSLPADTPNALTSHADAHFYLGVIFQKQDNLAAAIQEFQAALKIAPNSIYAQNNLREARRLLALKRNPQPSFINDSAYLPTLSQEPKLPIFRGTARIITPIINGSEIGAGWVVKRQGNTIWVVTNRHVVSDQKTKQLVSKPVQVEFYSDLPDEKRPRYIAKVLQATPDRDGEIDIAVLQITDDRLPKDIQPLIWNTDRLRSNQRIYVIGHPYNKETQWDSASGEITGFNPQQPLLPIDAKVAQGNSGGPVINEQNQVVGLFVAIRDKATLSETTLQRLTSLEGISPATGDIGLAYRIEVVIAKLRAWKILD